MSDKISRREFVKAGTAASVAATVPAAAFGQAPTVLVRKATPPVVISSGNGHEYRNGGPRTCVEEAWQRIVKGEDVLDSLIAGVNIVELDPDEMYVGYGGLPNADGVVQLDSCCMHGPLKRAGGVAALEGVRTPSRVAKAVMEHTDHHLLVGRRGPGVRPRRWASPIEADLNTDKSRAEVARVEAPGGPGPLARPAKRTRRRRGRAARDGGGRPPRRRATAGARSTATGWGRRARCAASPPPAASPSRSRGAWATRRSSAPASGWTTRWGRRARPAAARRTSTTSLPSSSWRRCGGAAPRRTRPWRR